MTRAVVRAKKVGGSIMVRLPKEVVDQENIHEGEMVEVDVRKAKKSWFGIDPDIGRMTKEDELDSHF
jgi:antitoxin component of MazEF toxin-antitoxin module